MNNSSKKAALNIQAISVKEYLVLRVFLPIFFVAEMLT